MPAAHANDDGAEVSRHLVNYGKLCYPPEIFSLLFRTMPLKMVGMEDGAGRRSLFQTRALDESCMVLWAEFPLRQARLQSGRARALLKL